MLNSTWIIILRHHCIDILICFDDKDGVPEPTPTYNSSILEDMFLEENSELLKKTFSEWKELGDALILLKVWIVNRYCYPVYIGVLKRLWLCADMGKTKELDIRP